MSDQAANETAVELEVSIPLRTTDFDRFCKIKPSAVLELFQEAATHQAEKMGIGYSKMISQGVIWVVIRTSYEVVKQPQPYDLVTVRTWPHDPSKFSFLRDYQVRNSQGELIVIGTSEWVIMDMKSRSFVPLFDVYDGTHELLDERNYEKKPRKLRNFSIEGLEPYTLVPSYSTVDLNGHVNNSAYADFLIDAVSPDEGYEVRSFQIDFRHEVHEGDLLKVYMQGIENGVQVQGIDEAGDIMFAARVEI